MATFAIAVSADHLDLQLDPDRPAIFGDPQHPGHSCCPDCLHTAEPLIDRYGYLVCPGSELHPVGYFRPAHRDDRLHLAGLGYSRSPDLDRCNPSAVLFVIIPLYLIYMTLQVPNLQRQTEIDPKTKLYNARYFADALEKEYDRALRYDRPLTVVIGDLDLLRNINNTYGHLAGDVVLVKVAEILQNQFRGYDLVARFGGEEFAILMPETTPEEAFPRVEAVRQAIAATDFEVSTSVTPIKASISFGIAARNGQGSADDIIHDADVTLYRSKLMGRNVTCIYSSDNIDELFRQHRSRGT